jgi:hypothetical protein
MVWGRSAVSQARDWGYRMNMGMDAFESMFAKAKATEREALLAS